LARGAAHAAAACCLVSKETSRQVPSPCIQLAERQSEKTEPETWRTANVLKQYPNTDGQNNANFIGKYKTFFIKLAFF